MVTRNVFLLRVVMTIAILVIAVPAHSNHQFSNNFFVLGSDLEVRIFLENEYSFSGSSLVSIREVLKKSLNESWVADGGDVNENKVAVVTISVYAMDMGLRERVFHMAVTPKIFKAGNQGYSDFIEAVRRLGKPKLRNGNRRFEDGWEDRAGNNK